MKRQARREHPQGGGSTFRGVPQMFGNRSAWFYGLLIAAIVGPYALVEKNLGGNLWNKVSSLASPAPPKPQTEKSKGEQASDKPAGATTDLAAASLGPTSGSSAGAPPCDIPEAFRFDVSPQWITARWPRVTTVLAETDLQGLRVPLVTGPRSDDLAGSLTYYFNKEHQVERIAFQGNTGDERRLVAFLTQYYEMKPVPALGPGLYMTKAHGKPLSLLHLNWPSVVAMDKPTKRCEIVLELNRPERGASTQVLELLEYDKRAKRW